MDNSCPISDPGKESSHLESKAGHFYDGNHTSSPDVVLGEEGSMGLDYDQGQIRCAIVPEIDELTMGQRNMRLKDQGSHTQLKTFQG